MKAIKMKENAAIGFIIFEDKAKDFKDRKKSI
jgi:hypothetical protein